MNDYVCIRPFCRLYARNGLIEIGRNTEIGEMSTISAERRIIIGKGVLTGPHVFIADHNHKYENPKIPICEQGVHLGQTDCVEVEDGTWIGTNVVIVGNVHIGKNCVIGANSVVTKDIPDYSVAAGIPCIVLKQYNFETKKWERVK